MKLDSAVVTSGCWIVGVTDTLVHDARFSLLCFDLLRFLHVKIDATGISVDTTRALFRDATHTYCKYIEADGKMFRNAENVYEF